MRSILSAALALLAACAGPSQSAGGDPPPAQNQPPAAQPQPGQPSQPSQPAPTPPAPGGGGQLTVELVPGQAGSSSGEQNAAAEGGGGTVVVRGTATTPNPCHRLAASVDRSGGTVTLRISATADPDVMCIASIGAIPYTATIRGLPAGSYDLRVQHLYPGTGWETASVLQARVTVR
jgi:hypothetical protein